MQPVALDAQPPQTMVVAGIRPPRPQPFDCRCCGHRESSVSCLSPVHCEQGNQYAFVRVRPLWER